MPIPEKKSSRGHSGGLLNKKSRTTRGASGQKDSSTLGGSQTSEPNVNIADPVSDSDSSEDVVKNPEVLPATDVTIYNEFIMGPAFGCKFPVPFIRYMVERILNNKLRNKAYQPEQAVNWVREVADDVNLNMKGYCKKPRYKHVVQVIIYQQSGSGFFCGARAVWDELSDDYTCLTFDGTTFICIVMVFGLYQY